MSGKGTALVTGASSGIGAVYADRLAHRGYDLVLVARDAFRLDTLAERLRAQTGRRVDVLPADLAAAADLAKVAARVENDPAMTMLVNNAGILLSGGLLDSDADAVDRLIAVNITAPTRLAAAAARAFSQAGHGAIVNIASVLALAPEVFEGAYSGSKSYLLSLSLQLAGELKSAGVRVQAVLPGATRTELWERSGKDADAMMPGLVMTAGDLVDAALLGLDRGEVVTIPPLADETLYETYLAARLALAPHLSRQQVAPRYRAAAAAAAA
jgi:short-subunit dehydrogenase